MTAQIDRRFPELARAIRERAIRDPAYRTVLADYEEMCAWLAAHDVAPRPDGEDVENARNLVRELEDEILSELEVPDERNRDTGNVR